MSTKIEWTHKTVNLAWGCQKVSRGCEHCYAERISAVRASHPNPKIAAMYEGVVDSDGHWTGRVNLAEKLPSLPRKGCRIFVGSMTDLFQVGVPQVFLVKLWQWMEAYSQHTFQILTKRPERMADFLGEYFSSPLPNVWGMTTVCNQSEADEKIPHLLRAPLAVRGVSIEPMLGAVDLQTVYPEDWMHCKICGWYGPDDGEGGADHRISEDGSEPTCPQCGNDGEAGEFDWTREVAAAYKETILPGISWVICGGETGPGARPMHPDWVRSLRDQCQAADVPFFFKSWGEWTTDYTYDDAISTAGAYVQDTPFARIGKRRAGRLLDGRQWNEFPEAKNDR